METIKSPAPSYTNAMIRGYNGLIVLAFAIAIAFYNGMVATALLGAALLLGAVGSTLWEKLLGSEDEQ